VVRNLGAAGGGEVIRRGRREGIASVRVVRDGSAALPLAMWVLGRGLPVLVAGLRQRA
jgi:hypothetical protein